MSGILPDFESGDVLRAADLQALVGAVRAAGGCGAEQQMVTVRNGRRWRFFRRAGEVVLRAPKDGEVLGAVSEFMWQCGGFVRVVRGGLVPELAAALMNKREGERLGVYGTPQLKEVGDRWSFEYDLEGDEQQLTAAAWRAPQLLPDGGCDFVERGVLQFGVRWPGSDFLGRWQGVCVMWPMPQAPMVVFKRVECGFVQGCRALLPGGREQVLCVRQGGYYRGRAFVPVRHEWRGRLDVWGQLVLSGGNKVGE